MFFYYFALSLCTLIVGIERVNEVLVISNSVSGYNGQRLNAPLRLEIRLRHGAGRSIRVSSDVHLAERYNPNTRFENGDHR